VGVPLPWWRMLLGLTGCCLWLSQRIMMTTQAIRSCWLCFLALPCPLPSAKLARRQRRKSARRTRTVGRRNPILSDTRTRRHLSTNEPVAVTALRTSAVLSYGVRSQRSCCCANSKKGPRSPRSETAPHPEEQRRYSDRRKSETHNAALEKPRWFANMGPTSSMQK
jgi:hypothetical protein